MESGNPLLDEFVARLTGASGREVCFMPTASGDADHYMVRFYNAFRERGEASHISLFRRERGAEDVREHLLSQDLIYVGGGSVISLLGVWRAHGIDEILREAWEAGVVLCGLSAGSLCWFDEALSGFHGEIGGSRGSGCCPGATPCTTGRAGAPRGLPPPPARRDAAGFAAEDGAALHFVGTELVAGRLLATRGARAYRLSRSGTG